MGRMARYPPERGCVVGQREGDEFEWLVPDGLVRLRVKKVIYQPEAAGHFHLCVVQRANGLAAGVVRFSRTGAGTEGRRAESAEVHVADFWEYGKLVSMKTTLEVPDDLSREAKSRAALTGQKLKDVIAEGLRAVLYGKPPPARRRRHIKFPVLIPRAKAPLTLPDDAAYRAELLDDLAHHEASLR